MEPCGSSDVSKRCSKWNYNYLLRDLNGQTGEGLLLSRCYVESMGLQTRMCFHHWGRVNG